MVKPSATDLLAEKCLPTLICDFTSLVFLEDGTQVGHNACTHIHMAMEM